MLDIENEIKQQFQKLYAVINENESLIITQLNKYKEDLNNIKTEYEDKSKIIDVVCNNLYETVNAETQYFKNQVILCENIIETHASNTNHLCSNNDTQQKLEKLFMDAQTHYKEKKDIISQYKSMINKYTTDVVIDTESSLYNLTINQELYLELCENIANYLELKSKYEQPATTPRKGIHLYVNIYISWILILYSDVIKGRRR